jgi:hypothetical protein
MGAMEIIEFLQANPEEKKKYLADIAEMNRQFKSELDRDPGLMKKYREIVRQKHSDLKKSGVSRKGEATIETPVKPEPVDGRTDDAKKVAQ